MRGLCQECDAPVTEQQTAAFAVRGFEIERGAGGANAIRHREREPHRIWHAHCVDSWMRKQKGHGVQEALL